MRHRTVALVLVALLAACGDDTSSQTGAGGASGGAGGDDGPSTQTASGPGPVSASSSSSGTGPTATATSTGSGEGGAACDRSGGQGGTPGSVEEAWLEYCVPVRELEACLGCAPQECEELAAGIAAGYVGCEPEAIAFFGCLESLARSTEPADCICGADILECAFDPSLCSEEAAALDACGNS